MNATFDFRSYRDEFFYYRYRWSTPEPEEGKYAWEHDERFKKTFPVSGVPLPTKTNRRLD